MSNVFTGLFPTIYEALDIVSRELVGFIPAVSKNTDVTRAAVGETITWPVVAAQAAGNYTPAAYGPDPSGQTVSPASLTLSKSRNVPFYLTGEEQKGLSNGGNDQTIIKNTIAQAFRTLCNEIEADLYLAAIAGASRADGTAGTAPFATAADLTDLASMFKILTDNGAPTSDRHLVLNSAAAFNIRAKQSSLFKVNEAGTPDLLRNGSLGRLMGMEIGESGAPTVHVKGTGTAYVFNGTNAKGLSALAVKTGSNTIVAGDILTMEDDTGDIYVVNTALGTGVVTIGKPGLRQQQTDGKTVTVGNNYTASVAFDRQALLLGTRPPAQPTGGDAADDSQIFQDPFSGLAFEVAEYRQYGRVAYDVRLAWGTAAVKSEHIALLLG